MSWHYKYIDDHVAAFSESGLHLAAMEALFLLPGTDDAAIYSRLDLQTGGVHFYFTPDAKSVATTFGAIPCAMPSRSDLKSLDIGSQSLIDRLYP